MNYVPIQGIDNSINMISNSKKYSEVKFMSDSKNFFLPTTVRIIIENSLSEITKEEQKEVDKLNSTIKNLLKKKQYEKCLNNIQLIFSIFKNTKYISDWLSSIDNLGKKKIFYDVKVADIGEDYLEFIRNLSLDEDIDVDIELLEDSKSFNHLSYGQQQLLKKLHVILNNFIRKNIKIKKHFVFIDEFELGLHPNWQKKVIEYMVDFFKLFDFKIDLLLTTHSPFLLSDIPKQNIIFLDKDENGNCKVVDGLKEKKQTFGANIHTLLSDSFFMEDGLMGEFAKGKIDEAIRLLNKDKLDEKDLKYCEQIISIIGEPIVKNQLQRMLTDKKISYLAKDTREEIEFLKHRIDLLSKRL